jgi:hypothetical protein
MTLFILHSYIGLQDEGVVIAHPLGLRAQTGKQAVTGIRGRQGRERGGQDDPAGPA